MGLDCVLAHIKLPGDELRNELPSFSAR
jgi:hypothetical protein